jgi:hypothetical protein
MMAAVNDLHRLDPKTLTAAQKSALKLAKAARLIRCRNGWRGVGTRLVSLKTAGELQARGLVRPVIDGRTRLDVTGAGNTVLAVMQERAGR